MMKLASLFALLFMVATPALASGVTYTDVTMSPDTSIFASGDLIADTQPIADAFASSDTGAILYSVEVIDEDDQGAAFDIYFLSSQVTMGSENSAPSISDANIRTMYGYVAVATGDYKDLGGARVAVEKTIGLAMAPAAGSRALYVAIVNGSGTPTYTASGLKLRVGIWTP